MTADMNVHPIIFKIFHSKPHVNLMVALEGKCGDSPESPRYIIWESRIISCESIQFSLNQSGGPADIIILKATLLAWLLKINIL